jgi:thiazole/oxazole-forming peptide maturase SagD family component
MTRSGAKPSVVPLDGLPASGDALLDLLDGSRDVDALSVSSGVAPATLVKIIDELDRLGMLADRRDEHGEIADRRSWLRDGATPSGSQAPLRVLLGGLGDLGLSVLRDLRRFGNVQGYLVDPAPVGWNDVGPFYRDSDVGRQRSEVVASCLADGVQPPLRHLELDASSPAAQESVLATRLREVEVAVWCMDQPTATAAIVATACRSTGVPLVLADVDLDVATVGISPGRGSDVAAGCAICALHHRAARDPFRAALLPYLERRFPRPVRWHHTLGASARHLVADLVVLALCKAGDVRHDRRPDDNLLLSVDLDRRTARLVPVAKHPACRPCFPAMPAAARDLRRHAERRWLECSRREGEATVELGRLRQTLQPVVGDDYALFRPPRQVSSRERQSVWRFARERGVAPATDVVANAHRAVSSRPAVAGTATTSIVSEGFDLHDPSAAECLSLVEGLERLFALDWCDPERVVQARYAAIAGDALDPRRFPLYADWQYREPGFGLRPFDPEDVLPWLWGVRIDDGRPVLIPRDLVYASASPGRIYRANSNGAACHSDYHRAVLNAIHETVERDAFMIAWLARLSLPRIALGPADGDPSGVRRSLEALSFRLEHVDLTTDLGIPVVLGILRDRLDPGFVLVDMVSAWSEEEALAKLSREVVQFAYPYLIDRTHYHRAVTAGARFDEVLDFPDHPSFYQHPDKQRETAFLDGSPRVRAVAAAPSTGRAPTVRGQIAALVARLARHGHEVIVVDCTAPLLARLGLHAVKVIIPGLQPLSAGHRFRVLGGRRPFTAPVGMGMADRALTLADLNPWPHPFW